MNQNDLSLYSKITDDMMLLGTNMIVRMNVILYSNSEKYGRKYYYREVQYLDRTMEIPTRKISRSFEAFLSIENLKAVNTHKEFFVIRGRDIEFMRLILIPTLENMLTTYNEMYEFRKGKLYLTNPKVANVNLGTEEFPKVLTFRPAIRKLYSDKLEPVLMVMINNDEQTASYVSYSTMFGFLYLIRTLQLDTYGAIMINSLGRPPLGSYLFDMSGGLITETEPSHFDNKPKQISSNTNKVKKKSYFNNN